jgi:hypothetical protein
MLYDPKWEKTTKADPFTLESLIAWLEKQPADRIYCYEYPGHCLIAKYLVAMGFEGVMIGPLTYRHLPDKENRKPLPNHWNDIAADMPNTFGAALKRARAALAAG